MVTVTPLQDPTTTVKPTPILVPVQGPGGIVSASFDHGDAAVRRDGHRRRQLRRPDRPDHPHRPGHAPSPQGFNTCGAQDSSSFDDSSLSITFSADGTTLYASDDDGIWQFKTTASLAGSTSGSLIGLNDLRILGVPYDGQDSAVAVIDTGVDASTPNFRGRVATGTNVITNGSGNADTRQRLLDRDHRGRRGHRGHRHHRGHQRGPTDQPAGRRPRHRVAGVIAQFVPQATIDPVNIFYPFKILPGQTGSPSRPPPAPPAARRHGTGGFRPQRRPRRPSPSTTA